MPKLMVDPGLTALIAAQDGVIARAQALLGMSRQAIEHRCVSGRWNPLLPGIYLVDGRTPTQRQRLRAALLYCGPSAQLTGLTACHVYGVRYLPPGGPDVHVLIDHSRRCRSAGFVKAIASTRLPLPVVRAGLSITPVARSVIDATRDVRRLQDVRAIVADAVQRGLTTPEELATELGASHSAGSRLPRIAVNDMVAGVRSAPEADLRDLVRTSDVLPEPEWNARVVTADGLLVAIADAWWRRVRMAGEVNSREHHFFGDTWEATMRRQARLAAEDIVVVPLSPHRIRTSPTVVLRELESTYVARLTHFA